MKKFLSCEDVAEMYGVKITTVWSWIRAKKLPVIKIGRLYRIRQEDLDKMETANLTVKDEV